MSTVFKRSVSALVIGSVLGSLAFTGVALAKDGGNSRRGHGENHGISGPKIVGTVATAPDVNGTFTILLKDRRHDEDDDVRTVASTTVTVATASTTLVRIDGAVIPVSAIAVGDRVKIRGTMQGNSVISAASIKVKPEREIRTDERRVRLQEIEEELRVASRAPLALGIPNITGNGQPIVGGTVTAVSSSTLSVTNKNNVTFAVNAANANIVRNNATTTLAGVAIGDAVIVQGTVNGTAITASSVIDQDTATSSPKREDIFGAVARFLSRLFGFF